MLLSEHSIHIHGSIHFGFSFNTQLRSKIYVAKHEENKSTFKLTHTFDQIFNDTTVGNATKVEEVSHNEIEQYETELLKLYVRCGDIDHVVRTMNELYHIDYEKEKYEAAIESSIKIGLNKLVTSYNTLRTKDRNLPELLLNEHVIGRLI